MDNAFLGPILSALGRTFLSRYNRGKKVNSNIQRMPLLIVMAWGCWIVSLGSLGFLIYFYIRFNQLDGYCMGVLAVAPLSGLLFYVWYRNAYVEITRSYVLRRDLFRFIEKVEYRRVRKYGYHERYDHNNNFEDGLYLGGPLVEGHKYSAESVELHSNWANFGYVLGQLAFRIVNERWAEPESDEDQNLIQEYISSGKAREICLEQSGFVFPENDNSPYRENKE